MPVEYGQFTYNYKNEVVSLPEWLKSKDDEGWEFISFIPKDYSGTQMMANNIVKGIFRKKT